MRLEERVAELEEIVARFRQTVAELQEELRKKYRALVEKDERIRGLEAALEVSHRAGKRQASPFSKGELKPDPERPGRKSGDAHGRHGHRMAPAGPPDQEPDASLPACCPSCGGELEHERDAEQYQVDIGELKPVTTQSRVAVGRCKKCRRRVQRRRPEQTSDALGAAGSQVGPTAKAWASFLHYHLGLSWVKVSRLLTRLGVPATAGALCQAEPGHEEVRKFLAHLEGEAPAMFTFLYDERVDATNWRAKQGMRPTVVNRKVWGGNHTDRGGRAQSVMTSVIRTAAQHGVDAID